MQKQEIPDTLKPYFEHGVELEFTPSSKNAIGECPWCGREGKFNVKVLDGRWRCLVCNEGSSKGGGNTITFIRMLWEKSYEATPPESYAALSEERNLDQVGLIQWGLAQNYLNGRWIAPGYSPEGTIATLYRWIKIKDSKDQWKPRLLPTSTLGQRLSGLHSFDSSKPIVNLAEGLWDGIALDDAFQSQGGGLENAVLSTPGCGVFFPAWSPLFSGKTVNIWFDNDYPLDNGNEPAALLGIKRISSILNSAKHPPSEINYLKWGSSEYHDETIPSGTDLRDFLHA